VVVHRAGVGTEYLETKSRLLEFTSALQFRYGSEEISQFLYAVTKMHRPRVILELGTGYGVSSFSMAQAVKENGFGHVWSVDSLKHFKSNPKKFQQAMAALRKTSLAHLSKIAPSKFLQAACRELKLNQQISFVRRNLNLKKIGHPSLSFFSRKVDLLYSDISHGPRSILSLLAGFLSKMSPASSIFVDSASTYWPSYLFLEQLVATLNSGVIPAELTEHHSSKGKSKILSRKYALIHLTYPGKGRTQNGTAWLKIQPADRRPYPLVHMRRG
jgi:methyltransferase family protein